MVTTSITAMAAYSAQPWRRLPTIRPKVAVSAAGISRMNRTSTKLESVVAFSNGKALLTLKNPPPLVPSCLMAIWEAAGPSASVCSAPPSVSKVTDPLRVWITPWETRISAPTSDSGSSM